jgi:hypothetical protein
MEDLEDREEILRIIMSRLLSDGDFFLRPFTRYFHGQSYGLHQERSSPGELSIEKSIPTRRTTRLQGAIYAFPDDSLTRG